MRKVLGLLVAAAASLACPAPEAVAADWPTRPVRIVVPYSAGGQSDVIARVFAEQLSKAFGQQFYIENTTGAGGAIAAKNVARSDPDGQTLMITGWGTHVLAPAINKNAGFDPMKEFTHVAFIGGSPNAFVVHPSAGVKTFDEFIKWAKASNGIEYVSPGLGSGGNAVAEYFAAKAGIKLIHVPHRGGGTAAGDLIAGHVKMGSFTWATAREQVSGKTVLPIAISAGERLKDFPDIPTLKELGYPDIVSTTWLSLSGPAGLPKDIADKLNKAVNDALKEPSVRKHLEQDAFEIKAMSPAEITRYMQEEIDKWLPALRQALNIK
jgi:tripartite-type tricarboxylate transporter receptor subunit TctC